MSKHPAELERLHQEVGPNVWSYLRRRVSDVNVAEELFQETFLRVAENPGAVEAACSERAWLIGIARNLLREHFRRSARHETETLANEPATKNSGDEDVRIASVRNAIRRLPAAQQEVLVLRIEQEMTYAEIAESLDVPIGTVRSRLHNAIGALRSWAATLDA